MTLASGDGNLIGFEAFGVRVRKLRESEGLRQADLASILGVARSTLANIERVAEPPSNRIWDAIAERRPDWVADLRTAYYEARSQPGRRSREWQGEPFLAGPFEMVAVSYIYVFEEARWPSEILEIRRVRAIQSGADRFGLRFAHTNSPELSIEQRALWGGGLREVQHWTEDGRAVHWGYFDFGRTLRRGEQHEFAIRTFIERDPDPPTDVNFSVTVPTTEVAIHLSFQGTVRPTATWRYGPREDDLVSPGLGDGDTVPVRQDPNGGYSARFRKPERGRWYGVGWAWPD